jgi:hypothetical protein
MKARTVVSVLTTAVAGATAGYLLFGRKPCLTWGAAAEDVERIMPGDELLEYPDLVSTRAISICAPPSAIWPWIVQMGSGKAGMYTYDWIENLLGLNMHSADEILPQFQDRKVGDLEQIGSKGPRLQVAVLEPEKALVVRSEDGNWVWAFCLYPTSDGRTVLVSRNRIASPGASARTRLLNTLVMEPGSLVMERKMLRGIRQRAEKLAARPVDTSGSFSATDAAVAV